VTPGGTVAADRVVLATNAWSVRFREVRRRLVIVGSDIVATEPIPGELERIGWTDGLAISDSRLLVHYYRTTLDGRIAFGKGGGLLAFDGRVGARFDGPSPRRAVAERAFRTTYPELGGGRLEDSWTGPIDRTRSGLPFFGPLDERRDVFVGCGYSGNGVGPSFLAGRILAAMALGVDDEWSSCGLVGLPPPGFPPEPFRFVGGNLVRSAIERSERAEDAGRTPGRVSRALVRLAPGGLVPTKRG
jgi:glycine/D-amino acid oxidase-like deaminating enzyme